MFRHCLLTLVLLGCSASAEKASTPPKLELNEGARVEVAQLETQRAQSNLSFTGEVRGLRDATLASATGGLVEAVRVQPGEVVRKGKVLVTVDRTLTAARLTQVKAQARQAKREWERLQQLGDGVSTAQLEQAETASIIADAAYAEAKALLQRASISAPFDGTVADVDAEVGEVAAPGTPLVHMVSTDPVQVRISASDRDIIALKEGLTVSVTASARPKPFVGTVTGVRAAANPRTRSFLADISVDNPDGLLLPGMIARVQAQIDLGEHIVVPQNWIVLNGDQQGVFIAQDGKAVWRDVTLGQVLNNQVIVHGVNEGETIIFNGHRNLLDGDAILVSRQARCCEAGRPIYE